MKRYILCVGLVMASCNGALAANDGVPAPAPADTGERTDKPGTSDCRQAKAKSHSQLTPEQKAQRKAAQQAMRAQKAPQGTAEGTAKAHKPRPAKAPLC